MYSEQEYLYGWLLYGAGAILIWGAGFVITRGIGWWRLRWLLRVALAAWLAVPWYTDDGHRYLAPAWIIAAFEGLFENPSNFWRAGRPLLAGVGLAVALTTVVLLLSWMLKRRSVNSANTAP